MSNATDPNDNTLALMLGEDLVISGMGGLAMVAGWEQVKQRILRRLFTNPAFTRADGQPIPADYIFDPEYGIGVNTLIGEPQDSDFRNRLRLAVNSAVLVDQSVDATSPPEVELYKTGDPHVLIVKIIVTLRSLQKRELIVGFNR